MSTLIFALHIVVTLMLILVVLFQRSEEGAGLGEGSSGSFSPRGRANFLTRLTSILAALFIMTNFTLAVLAVQTRKSELVAETPSIPKNRKNSERQFGRNSEK